MFTDIWNIYHFSHGSRAAPHAYIPWETLRVKGHKELHTGRHTDTGRHECECCHPDISDGMGRMGSAGESLTYMPTGPWGPSAPGFPVKPYTHI